MLDLVLERKFELNLEDSEKPNEQHKDVESVSALCERKFHWVVVLLQSSTLSVFIHKQNVNKQCFWMLNTHITTEECEQLLHLVIRFVCLYTLHLWPCQKLGFKNFNKRPTLAQ